MSERETNSDSKLYDIWFREKVQEALDDPRPCIPHDAVMDEAKAIIDRIAAKKAKGQRSKRERVPESARFLVGGRIKSPATTAIF